MNTFIKILIPLLLIGLSPGSKSKCSILPDSIKINENYKLMMYDESELNGKVIKVDSAFIDLKMENDDILHINRNDIRKIINSKYYNWCFSSGFLYSLNLGKYENNDNNSTGFCISVSKKTGNNLWFKFEYEFTSEKEYSNNYGYERKIKIADNKFKAVFCYQKIKPDVTITPILSAGFSYTKHSNKYEVSYYDLYNNTNVIYDYEDAYSFVSIVIEGGLSVRLYKNFMLFGEASLSLGIIPFLYLGQDYTRIPLKIGASIAM
jgi:hypothetical protein